MNWKTFKKVGGWVAAGVVLAVAVYALVNVTPAKAADLGGNCCSDLEERIAELEATTARKGNRKVSLTVSGQINKAILWWNDIGDLVDGDARVIENGAAETYIAVHGEAKIRPDLVAGYRLEVGQGKTSFDLDGATRYVDIKTDNDLYTRQSYAYIVSKDFGALSIGLQSTATDDLTQQNVANTDAISKRLTIQPIGGVTVSYLGNQFAEIPLEPFNGRKADSLKYTSPTLAGFSLSAAWVSSDDAWDVALRYAGKLSGFEVVGAVGYYDDKVSDLIEPIIGNALGDIETKTLTLNGGLKHVESGLFLQASWARLDFDSNVGSAVGTSSTDAYHIQAGIERKIFTSIGETTVFGEYLDWSDLDLSYYGLGINQSVLSDSKGDSLADLYFLFRRYDAGSENVDTVLSGLRLKF